MVRSQIPKFRLPDSVIDEECGYILESRRRSAFQPLGQEPEGRAGRRLGRGIRRHRRTARARCPIPGRQEAAAHIHIGIDWLANVAFGHTTTIAKRVIVLGGGNTAMDCCRSARRMGGDDVKVIVRSGFDEMKASPWEKEEAIHEGIPIINMHVPKEFCHEHGKLKGVLFEIVRAEYDAKGRRSLVPTGEPHEFHECDEVLVAIGQENAFPWIENDIGLEFDKWGLPVLNEKTLQSTLPKVFFGGDSAFGPKNIITAAAQGHEAAISIDLFCQAARTCCSARHPWSIWSARRWASTSGATTTRCRRRSARRCRSRRWKRPSRTSSSNWKWASIRFMACAEAERCLNCDIETVFTFKTCIECDACVDICPTECITFTANGEEDELRGRLKAPARNPEQALYVSDTLKTGRVMVKDENICLHCGMCAERCPTGAWDMQKFFLQTAQAGTEARRT
jgi:formate dehydrogenase beta subunit